ncbi:sporulation histidine kinase inhibitor Sda [Paenibacillus validus]|uniref:sporulation histidine kinase inhibitor Sda n=1 Tax=Paenibacillus validus TaxID=44253 RepID=UPI003D28FF62
MSSLKLLNDAPLLESYELAVHLGLEQEFLDILFRELKRRKIDSQLAERRPLSDAEARNEA